jgi:hypothetical protein
MFAAITHPQSAYAAGIINQTFFVSLVMLSVVTSLAAGSWLERVADRLTVTEGHRPRGETSAEADLAPPERPVATDRMP